MPEKMKSAVVTGASRGIGAAIAERLAKDGFAVAIGYVGDDRSAAAVAARIESSGGTAVAVQADVSDPAGARHLFDTAESTFGGVHVLVNNAGIMELAPIAETADASFDRQVAINLKGTFNGLREAAKRLQVGGRIINVSSSMVGLLQPTYGGLCGDQGRS